MTKNSNFFRIEMLFLKILKKKDCYGYEITHEIADLTHGRFTIKEGTMYPILYKLEEIGYISSRKVQISKRMSRIYYHLEPSGMKYLEDLYIEYQESIKVVEEFMNLE